MGFLPSPLGAAVGAALTLGVWLQLVEVEVMLVTVAQSPLRITAAFRLRKIVREALSLRVSVAAGAMAVTLVASLRLEEAVMVEVRRRLSPSSREVTLLQQALTQSEFWRSRLVGAAATAAVQVQ